MAWPCTQGFEVEDKEAVPDDRWAEKKWNSFRSSGTENQDALVHEVYCARYALERMTVQQEY